jgi:hypothetical protein
MSENAPARKSKSRSPSYPAINLETAIQRARLLYDKERHYLTPVATIASHWGYRSLNGPAMGAIAALKKYGLLDEEGAGEARKAKLSELADVILVHPDESQRKAAIREAALRPPMHREMWDKYRDQLPSEQNLLWELTRNRGFTETGAKEFIPVYRATVAFAQLGEDDRPSEPAPTPVSLEFQDDQDDDNQNREPEHSSSRRERHQAGETARSYNVPLIDNGAIVVEGQFPITERDWNQFIAVLTAMKPGLVATLPEDRADA